MIDRLLQGNQQFLDTEFNARHEYYEGLAKEQTPQYLWIGCSDSRVSEHIITSSQPGTIFVHRNVANIVSFNDVNIAAILEYALLHLKIPDIIVCGHYGCGGVKAMDEGIEDTYIADWLLIGSGAKEKADRLAQEQQLSPEAKHRLLVEENVRLQLKHLQHISIVKRSLRAGEPVRLHGWVYSLETGKINVLIDGKGRT